MHTTSPTKTGFLKVIASTATVTVRPFAIFEAKIPPAMSICPSTQPPKMSPFWLVSAGMASVRIESSPRGSWLGVRSAFSIDVSASVRRYRRGEGPAHLDDELVVERVLFG